MSENHLEIDKVIENIGKFFWSLEPKHQAQMFNEIAFTWTKSFDDDNNHKYFAKHLEKFTIQFFTQIITAENE